ALNSGAIGFICKPVQSREVIDSAIGDLKSFVSRPKRKVAVLMSAGEARELLVSRLNPEECEIVASEQSAAICDALRQERIDCLVIESGMSELQPNDLVEILDQRP